jgi:uncharacterized protein (TIGR02147 family)
MRNRPGKPSVFNYRLSHIYLADLFEWYKGEGVSLRNLAKRLNVSPSLLSLIAKSRRPLTEKNIEIWAPVFNWNAQEESWLKQLIFLEHASVEEKQLAMEKLSRFSTFQENSDNELVTFKYLKKWWNIAIREMSELPDFEEDEEWIQNRLIFKVPAGEIRKALKFLNKHKLLAKYGTLRSLNCQGNVYKLALSGFHDQMLNKAVESIYKVSSDDRFILGHTLTIPTEKFSEARLILQEALDKVNELRDQGKNSGDVYHFSFLGFPLTKKDKAS